MDDADIHPDNLTCWHCRRWERCRRVHNVQEHQVWCEFQPSRFVEDEMGESYRVRWAFATGRIRNNEWEAFLR